MMTATTTTAITNNVKPRRVLMSSRIGLAHVTRQECRATEQRNQFAPPLFDHLVGEIENVPRDGNPNGFGGP
jgi:exosome complex RNA-binding protein Rrp4